ncbi:heme/hemin ABC transporter substrate-binding protein [Acetobacter ascendens]|uniref:Hemin-binding periplasmic protein HmuT n=1 Tax=Acetobacter ascendens TaxID=481146 RepID=A0A1Y0V622_9PROT|nr:ABC transporter substrate-binding protein [Acetobacter ascendens]ARW11536.1 Hemin-binding periplasmic protein HmuT [Acetobacter ascendens]
MKNQWTTSKGTDQIAATFLLSRRSVGVALICGMASICMPRAGLAQDVTDAVTPRSVTDCRGRRVTLHGATRIASIGGTITETLYALGRSPAILAVDQTSTWPEQARKEKKDLGYMRAISSEGVLSLRPDLVLTMNDAGPPAAMDQLVASGIPVVFVDATPSPEAIEQRTRFLAGIVGAQAAGEQLCSALTGQFQQLEAWRATHTGKPRVLFIMRMTNNRPMAAGKGTAADAMISLAGGVNAGADMQGYKIVDQENLVALRPDIILLMDQTATSIRTALQADPGFKLTPAGRNNAFVSMEGERLLGFGLRTPQAALDLARMMAAVSHPV